MKTTGMCVGVGAEFDTPGLEQHGDEGMMTEFAFLGQAICSLYVSFKLQ